MGRQDSPGHKHNGFSRRRCLLTARDQSKKLSICTYPHAYKLFHDQALKDVLPFPSFHDTGKQSLEPAMTPSSLPCNTPHACCLPRHHRRLGPASFLAFLVCCSTTLTLTLGFLVTPRTPFSQKHVPLGRGQRGESSTSSGSRMRQTTMMTAGERSPSSTFPAVLGGLSLPFLARTSQAALAAPGAGRIVGKATDIPPPAPPSNSRIERSITPRSSSFDFSRSIPKVRT